MNENCLRVSSGEGSSAPGAGGARAGCAGRAGMDPACADPGAAARGKGRKQPCLPGR